MPAGYVIRCEKCHQEYLSAVEREFHGFSWANCLGAAQQALRQAKTNLESAWNPEVDPVACPACGWYQEVMVSPAKVNAMVWSSTPFAFVVAVCFALSLFDVWEPALFVSILAIFGATLAAIVCWFWNPNSGYVDDEGREGHRKRAERSKGTLVSVLEAEHEDHNTRRISEMHRALRSAMVAMAGADGNVDDREVIVISEIYSRLTQEQICLEEIRSEAEKSVGYSNDILDFLRNLEPSLSYDERALFVRTVVQVAAADKTLHDREWELIAHIGDALSLMRPAVQQEVDAVLRPSI